MRCVLHVLVVLPTVPVSSKIKLKDEANTPETDLVACPTFPPA
jgi:hypothetical protein